jgi:hypothetical protein
MRGHRRTEFTPHKTTTQVTAETCSRWRNCILFITVACLGLSGCQPLIVKPPHPSTVYRNYASHMSENKRSGITRVAVIPGNVDANFILGGPDYGKQGDEVGKGVADGVNAALSPDMGGSGDGAVLYILLLPLIIPTAALLGGISGAVEAEVRENNKEAADALIAAYDGKLPNVQLAREIGQKLADFDGIEATVYRSSEIEQIEADAMLTINVTQVSAEITDSKGRLGVSVEAVLVSLPDREQLYREIYGFHDTRSMSDWAADNAMAWREHLRKAKIKVSERIVHNFFTLLELRHVLRPIATESYKNFNKAKLNSTSPELAWDFLLLGDDSHLQEEPQITPDMISWDLAIRIGEVTQYERKALNAQQHVVEEPLDQCTRYNWSVRPRYSINDVERVGEWMTVSRTDRGDVIAITQDFHFLQTPCS